MRVANAAVSYTQYIQKMIWPHDLAVLYPYSDVITAGQFIGAVLVLGAITFLSVRYRRQLPWLFVGWFWFAGTLVLVIGLVQVGVQRMADRYTYLPLVGLFVILCWGTNQFVGKWRYKQTALFFAAAAPCLLLITAARIQVSYWKNSIALFERTLAVTADNYVIHNNLGFELALIGRIDEAIMHYRAALRINPEFEVAHINLGSAIFSQGEIERSLAYYQATLKQK
ncbi:MAG: tetratricopeptide repeat protein, partial [Deltaproteobacteria bacterium]|nr:tetratricopeptide repeat protein [Deltaproteobacteria bacterium]